VIINFNSNAIYFIQIAATAAAASATTRNIRRVRLPLGCHVKLWFCNFYLTKWLRILSTSIVCLKIFNKTRYIDYFEDRRVILYMKDNWIVFQFCNRKSVFRVKNCPAKSGIVYINSHRIFDTATCWSCPLNRAGSNCTIFLECSPILQTRHIIQ